MSSPVQEPLPFPAGESSSPWASRETKADLRDAQLARPDV
jgi:hypothetical protein